MKLLPHPCTSSPQAGNDVFDLGEALYSFLVRYGEEFDYGAGAIIISRPRVSPAARAIRRSNEARRLGLRHTVGSHA
jgi:hypothetical protein